MIHEDELLELYGAIRRRVAKEVSNVLKTSGLGTRQFIILRALASGGQAKVGELTELCMTDAGTVSRSLTQLQDLGLVEKVQSEDDGRVWVVKLTKRGRAKIPQIKKLYGEISGRCFQKLDPAERLAFANLLRRLL